jgi:hypothetical protein
MKRPLFFRTNWLIILVAVASLAFLALSRSPQFPVLADLAGVLYQWLAFLGGTALLLGVANVVVMHLRRIQGGQRDWVLSLILLATLAAVLVAGLANPLGAASPISQWFFASIIAPGQAALFSLLVFFMAVAAYRYLRIGRPGGIWMLAGALLIWLVQIPMGTPWRSTDLALMTDWFVAEPIMAAVRGLLLGSGIALLVAGVRLVLGRP